MLCSVSKEVCVEVSRYKFNRMCVEPFTHTSKNLHIFYYAVFGGDCVYGLDVLFFVSCIKWENSDEYREHIYAHRR